MEALRNNWNFVNIQFNTKEKRVMRIEEELRTPEAKMNFIRGLIRLSASDGVIDESESAFFQSAAISMGLDPMVVPELIMATGNKEVENKVVFTERREKLFFFIQAIQLCYVDGSYSETERKEMEKIRQELDIEETVVQEIEKWVKEGMEWNNRGNGLLEL